MVLVWNTRDPTSEPIKDYEKVIRNYCPDFEGFSGRKLSALHNEMGVESENEFDAFFNGAYEEETFKNDLTNNKESFIGGALSASYAPNQQDENYSAFVTDLKACFNRHAINDKLVMPFITRSYFGTV